MVAPSLLHYRPWRGEFHGAGHSPWPIARTALNMMFRRKLFWGLFAFGLMTFLVFFFGQYLLAWAETQVNAGESEVLLPTSGKKLDPNDMLRYLRDAMKLNGTAETYRNFFWYQGYMVMVILALAGTYLVGNDFQFGSLPFYLSKPLGPWHYLLGKCLAIGAFVNLMTTVPALVLFIQYRTLYSWENFDLQLLAGILGYGMVLTVVLSLLLVAVASWLRRTVPLIMAWTTLLLFLRMLGTALVEGLQYDPRWRLIDVWNDTYVVGNYFLGLQLNRQPAWYEAALVLGAICLLCLNYLNRRIRAVEIVR